MGRSAVPAAIYIRKFVVKASLLGELVDLGTLTSQAAAFLEACVVEGFNIVVAGGTQAGKPTIAYGTRSAVSTVHSCR